MAIGEMLARYYRYLSMVDHSMKARGSWDQIAPARGTGADQAGRDYRKWLRPSTEAGSV